MHASSLDFFYGIANGGLGLCYTIAITIFMGDVVQVSKKIVGYKVKFDMGKRFKVKLYMTKEYYESWKYIKDSAIQDVWIEEVELEQRFFIS